MDIIRARYRTNRQGGRRGRPEDFCRPNVFSVSGGEAPSACGRSGRPLAATNEKSAGAICKRHDAVGLGTIEAARPPGAANGPPSTSHCSWTEPRETWGMLLATPRSTAFSLMHSRD